MAKKATSKAKIFIPDELELRRWCIEQAMKWPSAIYQQAAAGGYGAVVQQPDPIVRAASILNWIRQG